MDLEQLQRQWEESKSRDADLTQERVGDLDRLPGYPKFIERMRAMMLQERFLYAAAPETKGRAEAEVTNAGPRMPENDRAIRPGPPDADGSKVVQPATRARLVELLGDECVGK